MSEPSAAPDFYEHHDVTVKVDSFTIGVVCLALAVAVWVVVAVVVAVKDGERR